MSKVLSAAPALLKFPPTFSASTRVNFRPPAASPMVTLFSTLPPVVSTEAAPPNTTVPVAVTEAAPDTSAAPEMLSVCPPSLKMPPVTVKFPAITVSAAIVVLAESFRLVKLVSPHCTALAWLNSTVPATGLPNPNTVSLPFNLNVPAFVNVLTVRLFPLASRVESEAERFNVPTVTAPVNTGLFVPPVGTFTVSPELGT